MSADAPQAMIITVIAGMAVANFSIRFLPLAVLSRFELPEPMLRWLSFVPVSVMGTLVASEVLRPSGEWHAPATNPGIYAAVITALVFHFSRSFLGATLAGIISFIALRGLL